METQKQKGFRTSVVNDEFYVLSGHDFRIIGKHKSFAERHVVFVFNLFRATQQLIPSIVILFIQRKEMIMSNKSQLGKG